MQFLNSQRYGLSRKCRITASLLLLALISGGCVSEETDQPADFILEYLSESPHSPNYFTQGLFFFNGRLYESIGQYGKSALIKYQQDNQTPSIQRKLDSRFFAEGATHHRDTIYQLTWRAQTAFAYKGAMLSPSVAFSYQGEGWGLTSDGEHLWLSDGSDRLKQIDESGQVLNEIQVRYEGQDIDRLNELEWVDGWILANRWYDSRIFVINPDSGEVSYVFDLTDLANQELRTSRDNVLNGIAWNPDTGQLWITGKNWRRFYQFKLRLPNSN